MIDKGIIKRVLERALSNGADFSELFVERTKNSSIRYNGEKVKDIVSGTDFGAGVRVFYGTTAIYAYANDIAEEALLKVADAVSSALKGEATVEVAELVESKIANNNPVEEPNHLVPMEEKIDFIRQADKAARACDARITQVDANISERVQHILVANSKGVLAEDDRNYTRVSVSAVASEGAEKQTGSVSPGGHAGFEFIRGLNAEELGKRAADVALVMLEADYAPSGKMPVVIDNGFGGVIFHEACGHGLETTAVAKNASVFAGKIGEKVANEAVTAIDDGTIANAWGSCNVDDEGRPTQKTVLIEKGILKSYMVDTLGGLKTGYEPTGSGRRQSYKFAPTSRMRNTYIDAGPYKKEELIASIEYGLYAAKMGGGSVEPGTGDYNFVVSEGYMIRDGKIAEPVRGATLIGNGAETLLKISMVSDNLEHAQGMCGSASGSIPSNVGQPAVKVDEIVVGGR